MRVLVVVALFAVAGGVTWRFPVFHVVPLGQSEIEGRDAAFDAKKAAGEFWRNRLTPALGAAADAVMVLAALDKNADAARLKYGRAVGLSRSSFFFIRGSGMVVAIEKSRLGVALGDDRDAAAEPDLWLATGRVFGNAVRDATGLLQSKQFPNSQHFNELAAALNTLVEQRIMPQLREGVVTGQAIRFVACVEIPGGRVKQPLQLIPIQATVE